MIMRNYIGFHDLSFNANVKAVEYAEGTNWESIKCPVDEGHQRSGDRIGSLQINIVSKKKGDFLWTFLSECIITDKVAQLFKEEGFTGFRISPVRICNMSVAPLLWEFIVIGKGGDAHPDSGIYLKYFCKHCGYERYSAYENGIIVNERNWDGSDFFTVTGYPRHILITPKVRDCIIKNKLTNVKITPAEDLQWPLGVIKP